MPDNKQRALTTLGQFIIERQNDFPYAKGELSRLLRDIAIAAKIVNRAVSQAGLLDILGAAGEVNVQGEDQMKLDVYANDQFIAALRAGGECCVVASEEDDDIIPIQGGVAHSAKYAVCMDPLDGSSNIDVNVCIGTIFSIYRRKSESGPGTVEDVLQLGRDQVAAGYIIYGPSTMLVYTTGRGVNGFTLDPSIGEFCLSHPNMRIPEDGKIFSVNEGNSLELPPYIQEYVEYCKQKDAATNRPYSARYIGSMVADIHRNLIKGGIFLYPATTKSPNGKLRLLYEANPFAMIVEQAGGTATTGTENILDMVPTGIHQRVPLIIGSKNMVAKVLSMQKEPTAMA